MHKVSETKKKASYLLISFALTKISNSKAIKFLIRIFSTKYDICVLVSEPRHDRNWEYSYRKILVNKTLDDVFQIEDC